MKVRPNMSQSEILTLNSAPVVVDYILFLTADVTVDPNLNEIRDYKYVDKKELQAMFDDSSMSPGHCAEVVLMYDGIRQCVHSLV